MARSGRCGLAMELDVRTPALPVYTLGYMRRKEVKEGEISAREGSTHNRGLLRRTVDSKSHTDRMLASRSSLARRLRCACGVRERWL